MKGFPNLCSDVLYNRTPYSDFKSFSGSEWNSAVTDLSVSLVLKLVIGISNIRYYINYDPSKTELDLVCDNEWKKGFISCSTFVGFLLGSILGGSFADNYGVR